MTSKHLIDPELLPLLDALPDCDLSHDILPVVRAEMDNFLDPSIADDYPDVVLEEKIITGPEDNQSLRVLIYKPLGHTEKSPPAAGILHLHGGGMVMCKAEHFMAHNCNLVQALGCVVVSVDYRLAPENPHPTPIEDCYAALAWFFQHATELGVDDKGIAVTGESAGGGLAAALALLARDRGEFTLAFQQLNCPMLDDRTCVENNPNPFSGEFIWTRQNNRFGWSCLLGCEPGSEGVSAHASPARAESLAGLPPTMIYVGALDLFVDESMDYARRLIRAGVPTELHIFPGALHAFEAVADASVAKKAHHIMIDALKKALNVKD